jgi:branched-chain amino acid transport system permease protein
MNTSYLLALLGSALAVGALYGLLAIGFAVIYKATKVVNFAQGEVMMLIAYLSFTFVGVTGLGFWSVIPFSIASAIVLALAIERLLIAPMAGEPTFSIVMLTVGLAVCIRAACVLIWGAEPLVFPNRPIDAIVPVGPVNFTSLQLASIAAFFLYCVALWVFFSKTSVGLAMQAVAHSEATSMLMGINVRRVAGTAWVIAAIAAGLAGVFISTLYDLAPDIYVFGIRAFSAPILGGMDSVAGAAIAGVIIAALENLGEGYIGKGLKEIIGFIAIVLVMMVRPYGLFGTKDVERV